MKILVISPQPFFTPRGTPMSVYYRTLVTAQLGAKIDLLTYGEGQDVKIPGVRIIRIPPFAFLGSVKVGPSLLKLFLDVFLVAWTVALLLGSRYDVVHAHEEAVFFCRFLKPLFGFKLIYDMHSSLPQQLTNFKFTQSRFLIGLFAKLERHCLKAADAIITICPDLAEQVTQLIGNSRKHFLIENSIFDPIRLSAPPPSGSTPQGGMVVPERPLHLPRDRRLVVYAGTLEPYQGIDLLIRSFAIVLREDAGAMLLIVGGSPAQVNHYQQLAQSLGVNDHVRFSGRVAPDTARRYTQAAAVLVSPRCGGTNTPLKIYEQIASGIPLVATDIHSHTQVLSPEVAFLMRPEVEDLARGLLLALRDNGERKRLARNAKMLYEENYSRAVYEGKVRALLEYLS
jgi:glycosyltransferase involved in cell wall biosynthesis